MLSDHPVKNRFSNNGCIPLLLLWFWIVGIHGQNGAEALVQPKIGLSLHGDGHLSHHFSLAHRSYLLQDDWAYDTRHLDISYFLTWTMEARHKLSMGLKYRILEPFNQDTMDEIRITQQFNYANSNNGVRWGHRIRAEERLRGERTAFRLRYRLTADFPLEGQRLDIGELYSIVSLEPVFSVQRKKRPKYEGRLTMGLGKRINERTKAQCLLHYRKLDVARSNGDQVFLLMEVHFRL